ncbi:MAG: tRNA pseudouridine(55) synthase TruB [Acidimicrobiaceae bacterium]|nr:tRNA pseudouridine(55) synthase TruB [Acidimicrobiaceae bacterium]|tara:strand:+ start:2283 stop:3197 length:915 start_codon:yes stop_codon:yes gene_type:complete
MAGGASPGDRLTDGLVVIDKDVGWTSHDVVARLRGVLSTKKVGHSGTLDPDATGVLVLGVGRATRLLRFVTALGKEYTGQVVLGTETSTLDSAGEVTIVHDMSKVGYDEVVGAAEGLTGEILQVPPMVSAVKVGGRRLHEIAREGREVERAARPVSVGRFDVTPTDEPGVYDIFVACSSGTYVRTLAADLGAALGGGAHLRNLRRTAVGSFTLAEAHPLERPVLLPASEALRDLPRVVVDDNLAAAVSHGQPLEAKSLGVGLEGADAGPWPVYGLEGDLLAVYEPHGERPGQVKPAMVLAPASS